MCNQRQKLFVEEYLIDLNATQAAIRAGYSPKTAEGMGFENLRKPKIQAAIDRAIAARSKRTEITQDWVLQNFKEIAERCMQKHPVMYYDKVEKKLRQVKETVEHEEGTSSEEGVWAFDASNANRALENIGKHLGMFIERKEISGPGGKDLHILISFGEDEGADADDKG